MNILLQPARPRAVTGCITMQIGCLLVRSPFRLSHYRISLNLHKHLR
jgi:hypothetical protein